MSCSIECGSTSYHNVRFLSVLFVVVLHRSKSLYHGGDIKYELMVI